MDAGQVSHGSAKDAGSREQEPRTMIVFAEMYRNQPLVRIVDATDFVVLVSADSKDEVRIKPSDKWSQKGTDLALRVKLVRESGMDSEWEVAVYPASPCASTRLKVVGKPGRTLEHSIRMKCGSTLRFAIPSVLPEKDYEMMLLLVEEENEEEDKEKGEEKNKEQSGREDKAEPEGGLKLKTTIPAENPKKFVTLSDPSPEILAMILHLVPSSDVIRNLRPVSHQLFDAVKRDLLWHELQIGAATTLADAQVLIKSARKTCRKLTFGGGGSRGDVLDPRLYGAFLIGRVWPELRVLQVQGAREKLDFDALRRGVAEGNFPALTCLRSEEVLTRTRLGDLSGASLPSFRELSFSYYVGSSYPDDSEDSTALATFFDAFPRLERVDLKVSCPDPARGTVPCAPLMNAMADGKLPYLKELRYVIGFNEWIYHRYSWEPRDTREFEHRALERLSVRPESEVRGHSSVVVDGQWLLSRFPALKKIAAGKGVEFNWGSATDENLATLESVEVRFPGWFSLPAGPFSRMTNLEEVRITIDDTELDRVPEFSEVLALRGIRRLAVVVAGAALMDVLVGKWGRVSGYSPLRALRVAAEDVVLNAARLSLVGPLVNSFPNLTQLSLAVSSVSAPGTLGRSLTASKLTSLHLRESSTKEGDFAVFRGKVETVRSRLRGEWRVRYNGVSNEAFLMKGSVREWVWE